MGSVIRQPVGEMKTQDIVDHLLKNKVPYAISQCADRDKLMLFINADGKVAVSVVTIDEAEMFGNLLVEMATKQRTSPNKENIK